MKVHFTYRDANNVLWKYTDDVSEGTTQEYLTRMIRRGYLPIPQPNCLKIVLIHQIIDIRIEKEALDADH